jgi:outer membrane receptor for ferrienterochelin and colicins
MNIYITRMLLCSILIACVVEADAQIRTIKGKVSATNAKSQKSPLIGAIIATPDRSTGTQTDETGAFTLELPESNTELVVSYVGYNADTIKLASGNNTLNIALKEARELNEVVIRKRRGNTSIGLLDPLKTEKIGVGELMKAACCNLSESFETTPSVDVAFTDAISGYKQIQMLGLAGPYTLITRENIPDTRGLAAITGLTFTPGTWIEGMQLSKGTGSVVNGYESVAGQINIELLKPFEEQADKWYLNLYQSSQGRTEGNVIYNHKLSDRLSTNIFLHGKSQWLKQDNNNDGFLDQPLDKQIVALNRWFYFAPKGWEIQGGVKGTYAENVGGQWAYETGTEQKAGNPWGYEMTTKRIEGWAKIGKVFANKPATSIGLQLAAVHHEQDALYGSRSYIAQQNSFYTNLIYQSIIGNTNNVIKGGVSNLVDVYDETLTLVPYARNEIVPGIFTEYSYTHSDKFNLVAGLRGDYHSIYGAFATPRLHLRYAPFKRTAIRGSIGRAQRTANIIAENIGYLASNRAFAITSTTPGNPYGLEPEIAWNTGLNLTQKFLLNYNDGTFSVDYYYTDFQNQVVIDVENPHLLQMYNLKGQSFANSLQGQLDYELIYNLDLRLAYRWYDVQTTYGGTLKERPLIAKHRAFANVGYETKYGWKFDYTVQWTGAKRLPALHDHHNGGIVNETSSPSFITMNAQVSKTWKEVFEVYLGGENLTNYMQHDPIIGASDPYGAGFDASMVWGPVMGSNFYAGLRYHIK